MTNNRTNYRFLTFAVLFGFFILNKTFAEGMNQTGTISWPMLLITLFGGLSLFLYGLNKMSRGMKKAAGDRMRKLLSVLTKNRIIGMVIGAFVTMVIQSSSATTVMLVSFVQSELMTFAQTLGVILGANIGTTFTAQLIAFKLTDYALLMIAIGFGFTLFTKNESQQSLGEAILGFGLLFFGMKLMSDAMYPLRTYEPFINLIEQFEYPLLGLLGGAVFTALIQSSSAFTGIVIVLAQQGILSLEAGIPLILGGNIGTCVTAGLASINASRPAKRVAIAHVIFNIGGVLLFIMWIPTLADIIRWLSPTSDATGLAKLAAETPRQIANAHTVFNVGLALIFIPFTTLFASLIYKILPEKEEDKGLKPAIWHLDDSACEHPAVALDLAQAEIAGMANILDRMLDAVIHPFISNEPARDKHYPQLSIIEGVEMRENKLNYLEEKISNYLILTSRSEPSNKQAKDIFAMLSIIKDMESIGDIIDRNMIRLIPKKQALKTDFSNEGKEEIKTYHTKVFKQIKRLKAAFSELDEKKAKKIIRKEEKYIDLETKFRQHHLDRVRKDKLESVATHAIHMELMDLLKQINVYSANIAKTIRSMITEVEPN